MTLPVVLIAAVAANGVIGRDNRLLWRLKSDLKRFRALTLGKCVIMGRKTYDSIGKPLPGRQTVVVTRDRAFEVPGVLSAHSPEEAVKVADIHSGRLGASDIMVAGGGQIYAALIGRAQRLEITAVALSPGGDAFFPAIDPADWRETRRESHRKGPDDEADFSFVTYLRR